MRSCTLCPRECRANRLQSDTGFCTQTSTVTLARAALHFWEEPPISGWQGSGTVFFSGCPLRCVYCQNKSIASGDVAKEVSIERLAEIFLEQQGRGAHNINLVTPTHFAPQIVEALRIARNGGLTLPVVYNTSGYESIETLRMLEGSVDIYLTDFKYSSASLAKRYSNAADYPQVVSDALDAMFEQVGPYALNDETELLERGVIVRYLLLPGQLEDGKRVMEILASKPYAKDVCISLMSQYTPIEGVYYARFPELARTVDEPDYDELIDYALDLGLENSFCQEGGTASESFIPAFDFEGV